MLKDKEKEVPNQNLDSIKNSIVQLTKKFEGVDPTKEITDDTKKKGIINNLKELAYSLVDVSPQLAETIASMTPLSPISKPIGKSVSYFKEIIQHKLNEP